MLLLVVALLIGAVLLGLVRASAPNGKKDVNLGWMSDQWLAEYRAMHSS
jgi:hypothetical protein